MQKFKETRDSSYIYWNELERACFHHNITYGDFKNLARRRASSDKLLRDETFKIANNPKYDWRQWSTNCLIRKLGRQELSCNGQ